MSPGTSTASTRPGSACWSRASRSARCSARSRSASPAASLRPARMMILFALGWYAALLLFVQMPGPGQRPHGRWSSPAFTQSLSLVPMSVLLLHSAGERFRGRVMGVRMLAIYGVPIGLLAAGGADRPSRLCRDGIALLPGRRRADPRDRAALARRSVADRARRPTRAEIAVAAAAPLAHNPGTWISTFPTSSAPSRTPPGSSRRTNGCRTRRAGTSARSSRRRRCARRRRSALPASMSATSSAAAGSRGSTRRSSSRNWRPPASRPPPICRSTTWRRG